MPTYGLYLNTFSLHQLGFDFRYTTDLPSKLSRSVFHTSALGHYFAGSTGIEVTVHLSTPFLIPLSTTLYVQRVGYYRITLLLLHLCYNYNIRYIVISLIEKRD